MTCLPEGFAIIRPLGSGSQGAVYLVRGSLPPFHFAVKVIPRENLPDRSRLLESLRFFTVHDHPRILFPRASWRAPGGELCLMFRYVEHTDPRPFVARLGEPAAFSLLVQAAAGLAHLHSCGRLHADVKPENVLIQLREGDDPWRGADLVLSDPDYCPAVNGRIARAGKVTGTLGYLAPELFQGAPISPASDVFALGAWLFWLITGTELFPRGNSADAVPLLTRALDIPSPGRYNKEFASVFWSDLLHDLLHPDPSQRPADGASLLRRLCIQAELVEGASVQVPRLIWNPRAMKDEEIECLDKVAGGVDHDPSERPVLFRIQGTRQSVVSDAVLRLLAIRDTEPAIPELVTTRALPRSMSAAVLASETKPLVIDLTDEEGCGAPVRVSETLRYRLLSSGRDGGSLPPTVLIEDGGIHGRRADEDDDVFQLFETQILRASSRAAKAADWPTRLFSGIALDPTVIMRLSRIGLESTDAIGYALNLGAQRMALQLLSGRVGISESGAEALSTELAATDSRRALSVTALALSYLLSRLPDGLSAEACNGITRRVAAGREAQDELVATGVAEWTLDGGRFRASSLDMLGIPLLPAAWEQLQALLAAVRLGDADARPGSEDRAHLVVKMLAPVCDDRVVHRVIAWARLELRRDRPAAALALLRDCPPSLDSAGASRLRGRWLDCRARAWEALGESHLSISDRQSAITEFLSSELLVLAARGYTDLAETLRSLSRSGAERQALEAALDLVTVTSSTSARRIGAAARLNQSWRLQPDPKMDFILHGVADDSSADPATRALATYAIGDREVFAGNRAAGRRHMAQGLRFLRHRGDQMALTRLLGSLGSYHFSHGWTGRARRHYERILNAPLTRVQEVQRYSAETSVAGISYEEGQFYQALAANLPALATAQRNSNDARIRHCAGNISLILLSMGRLGEGLVMGKLALSYGKSPEAIKGLGANLAVVRILGEIGDLAGVLAYLNEARETLEKRPSSFWACMLKMEWGRYFQMSGEADRARIELDAAIQEFEQLGAPDEYARARLARLAVQHQTHETEGAAGELDALEPSVERLRNWRLSAEFRVAQLLHRNHVPAMTRVRQADDLLAEFLDRGFLLPELRLLEAKAVALMELNRRMEAQDVLRAAIARIKRIASGLPTPELQQTYLRDPRRQRFIELVRSVSSPG